MKAPPTLVFMGRFYLSPIVAQCVHVVVFLKEVWPRVDRLATHPHPRHCHNESTAPQDHH
jgi:hypothetical protein